MVGLVFLVPLGADMFFLCLSDAEQELRQMRPESLGWLFNNSPLTTALTELGAVQPKQGWS